MSRTVFFLTIEHILAIHARMIDDFGGDPAVRDQGLLESALAMPAAQFGGKFLHPTLADMAGAYLFHLCRNHSFVDGNKRTALVAAEMFLLLNDFSLAATNRELEKLTIAVADGSLTKGEVIRFFKKNVKKIVV
jgi:death on curing protein